MKAWKVVPVVSAVAVTSMVVGDGYLQTGFARFVFGYPQPEVFAALASIYGTLLGLVFAVTAVWVSFVDKPKLDRLAVSPDYGDISPMIGRTSWGMAVCVGASLSALMSYEHGAHSWALVTLLGVTIYTGILFMMVMYRFSVMLSRLTEAHGGEARTRRVAKSEAYHQELPGELDKDAAE